MACPGGAAAAPSWGKMWLSILNLYSWEGMNPTPAELLLLPEWTPVHPSRYWIHMRSVYFPFAFLYGKVCVCLGRCEMLQWLKSG